MSNYTDKEFHELPEWAKNEIFKMEGQINQLIVTLGKNVSPEFAAKQIAILGIGK